MNDELISSISSTRSASPTNVRIKAREMSASSVRSFLLCEGIMVSESKMGEWIETCLVV